jgi:TPP-dependent pyruvate/acetoin dehydrogenase alpha subunit
MPIKDRKESFSAPAGTPADQPTFSLISNDKLIQLYATMVKCRMIENRLQAFAGQRKPAAGTHAHSAPVAVIAGAAIDLGPEDEMTSLHDQLMAGFVKGSPIAELFRQFHPRTASSGKARPTPAARLKSAVKAAMAGKTNRSGNVAIVFARASVAALTSWRETLAIARRKMLPMIFVCYGDPPREPEMVSPRAAKGAKPFQPSRGFPAFKVDANDVVAVYRVAHEAISRARKDRGPSLIECAPYCVSGFSESRPTSVSGVKTAEAREAVDPIPIMENYLEAKGLFTAGMRQRIVRGFRKELAAVPGSGPAASGRRSTQSSSFRLPSY